EAHRRGNRTGALPPSRRARCFAPGLPPSLAGLLTQVGDDVGAILGRGDPEIHALAGNERLRIGEPRIEGLFLPHHTRALHRRRIVELGRRARLATVDAAMGRPDTVGVERMAAAAARLVEFLAVPGVGRGGVPPAGADASPAARITVGRRTIRPRSSAPWLAADP